MFKHNVQEAFNIVGDPTARKVILKDMMEHPLWKNFVASDEKGKIFLNDEPVHIVLPNQNQNIDMSGGANQTETETEKLKKDFDLLKNQLPEFASDLTSMSGRTEYLNKIKANRVKLQEIDLSKNNDGSLLEELKNQINQCSKIENEYLVKHFELYINFM